MTWQGIHGHDDVVERFRRSLAVGKLASTFLFVGPPGIGKFSFARKLAQSLLCEASPAEELEPCNNCSACQQVLAGSHPDLIVIVKPEDKNFIPVELLIGDREHRMREGFCHDISLKPYRGGRKIAILDDADYLNQEGANCLLKTLEEPPGRSLVILVGTSEQKQLPTIRSRCQVVRFRSLEETQVAELLQLQGLMEDKQLARRAAAVSEGSLQRAKELAVPQTDAFRQQLLQTLCQENWDSRQLAADVASFVDQAGKEAPARRTRLRQVIQMATDFYRCLLRDMTGAAVSTDPLLQTAVESSLGHWRGESERVAACLDRCLEATMHVDANANQATLLECWLDDLSQLQNQAVPEPRKVP